MRTKCALVIIISLAFGSSLSAENGFGQSMFDGDKRLFVLTDDTRFSIADNVSDANLKLLGLDDCVMIRNYAAKSIRKGRKQLRALEDYPPEKIPEIIDAVARPVYVHSAENPPGISPTPASESLWKASRDMRIVEIFKRSVPARLLADQGKIAVPKETRLVFRSTGEPPVTINLDFVHWSKKDLPELKRLFRNRYYGRLARERYDAIIFGQKVR